MRRYGLLLLALALSCSWESPNLPPTDRVLEGTYAFTWADNSRVRAQLEGAWLEFDAQGSVTLTNPGFATQEYGVVDVVESGTYSFAELVPDSGLLMLDISRQAPPRLAGAYVFHGGLNRLLCVVRTSADEELLRIRIVPDGSRRSWAHFVRQTIPSLVGDYTFVRSTNQAIHDLLGGARLSFRSGPTSADSTFVLTNPVVLEMAHQESLVTVVERGTYSVSLDSVRFSVASQEPAGADSLFLLKPPSVTVGVGFADGLLALTFRTGTRTDSTLWTPPKTVAEVEPNDAPSTATALGGTGTYAITGALTSGGVSPQGDYAGDRDYFSLTPGRSGEVRAELSWQGVADLDLFLYDAQNSVVARATTVSQAPPEAFTASVTGGQTYVLMVVSFDYPATYSCTVSVP